MGLKQRSEREFRQERLALVFVIEGSHPLETAPTTAKGGITVSISRAAIRGCKLDKDCHRAIISKCEYGPEDKRCFCYGLVELSTECALEKCRECKAYAYNAQPPKEDYKMKYWISKYALKKGVYEVEVKEAGDECIVAMDRGYLTFFHKGEYHENEAAARSAAQEMRTKKIASLRKQIERLERIKF